MVFFIRQYLKAFIKFKCVMLVFIIFSLYSNIYIMSKKKHLEKLDN